MTKIRILLISLLFSCATKPEVKLSERPPCYCGPVAKTEAPSCGVWAASNDVTGPAKVMGSIDGSCSKLNCQKLAKGFCKTIALWPHRLPPGFQKPATDKPCFCDEVLISDGNKNRIVCAAWQEGSKDLIEYRSVKNCSTTSCANKPFNIAKRHCQSGFVSFYQDLDEQEIEP